MVVAAPLPRVALVTVQVPASADEALFWRNATPGGDVTNRIRSASDDQLSPVMNNRGRLTVLAVYALTPGEITLDPVRMSDPKLLVLGLGITAGVATRR